MKTQDPLPQWIQVDQAYRIEGSPNAQAFGQFVRKWNRRPDTENKIMRRRGKVELNSLKAALAEDARKFDDDGNQTDGALDALYLTNLRRPSVRKAKAEGVRH